VVIEQEFLAEQFVEPADQENHVRRIAAVHDVEAAREEYLQRQGELRGQRPAVLGEITERAAGLERHRMAIDRDPVEFLEALFVPLALGANDRNLIPRGMQRARFLPDAPIERQRQVLDDDQHTSPCDSDVRAHSLFFRIRHGRYR
jgi:hypothetical protein